MHADHLKHRALSTGQLAADLCAFANSTAIAKVADRVKLPTYLPMRRDLINGRRGYRKMTRALFGGYGFILAADIAEHWDRIKQCPGVAGHPRLTYVAPPVRTRWGAGKRLCRNALPHLTHLTHLFVRPRAHARATSRVRACAGVI